MTAPELSAQERATVERFEAAPVLPESWEARAGEPDPFAPGTRVDVYPVPGGYVVTPAGAIDEDTARALADAARPAIEDQS